MKLIRKPEDARGECHCERPAVIRILEPDPSEWYCGRCGLRLSEAKRPSEELDALAERARRLASYAEFVAEFGEPDHVTSREALARSREHIARLPADHPGAAAAARYLAEPERVRQGQWALGDKFQLYVWEYADGTVGHTLGSRRSSS